MNVISLASCIFDPTFQHQSSIFMWDKPTLYTKRMMSLPDSYVRWPTIIPIQSFVNVTEGLT
jgi:hypothetical protein